MGHKSNANRILVVCAVLFIIHVSYQLVTTVERVSSSTATVVDGKGNHVPVATLAKAHGAQHAAPRKEQPKLRSDAAVNTDAKQVAPAVRVAPAAADPVFQGVLGPAIEDGPVVATTGPMKGQMCIDCIFIAVTACCDSWHLTGTLLEQLLASDDNLHVVVFDDMSFDGGDKKAAELGITVVQPANGKSGGLTNLMNMAWRYFYARPELKSLWLLNNDVQVSPYGTFSKLDRCLSNAVVSARSKLAWFSCCSQEACFACPLRHSQTSCVMLCRSRAVAPWWDQ